MKSSKAPVFQSLRSLSPAGVAFGTPFMDWLYLKNYLRLSHFSNSCKLFVFSCTYADPFLVVSAYCRPILVRYDTSGRVSNTDWPLLDLPHLPPPICIPLHCSHFYSLTHLDNFRFLPLRRHYVAVLCGQPILFRSDLTSLCISPLLYCGATIDSRQVIYSENISNLQLATSSCQ